jgi:hypothetical protein
MGGRICGEVVVASTGNARVVQSASNPKTVIKWSCTAVGKKCVEREYAVYRVLHSKVPRRHRDWLAFVPSPLRRSRTGHAGVVLRRLGRDLMVFRTTAPRRAADAALTVARLVVLRQAVDIMETLHRAGVVHNDLKPENFCVRDDDSVKPGDPRFRLCLIDFGLSTHRENPRMSTRGGTGTLDFSSARAMCTQNQFTTRWDDMEALVYTFLDIFNGRLPWEQAPPREVLRMKTHMPVEEVCRGAPPCLAAMLQKIHLHRSLVDDGDGGCGVQADDDGDAVEPDSTIDYSWARDAVQRDLDAARRGR